MHDVKALRRQQAELQRIRDELGSAIGGLLLGYADELKSLNGGVPDFSDVPGHRKMDMGLDRDVVAIPGRGILVAKELISLLERLETEVATKPQLDSLAGVPDENWDLFVKMYDEYLEVRKKADRLCRELHEFREDKIEPYR